MEEVPPIFFPFSWYAAHPAGQESVFWCNGQSPREVIFRTAAIAGMPDLGPSANIRSAAGTMTVSTVLRLFSAFNVFYVSNYRKRI